MAVEWGMFNIRNYVGFALFKLNSTKFNKLCGLLNGKL